MARQKLIHLHGSVAPTTEKATNMGEILVQHGKDEQALYTLYNDGTDNQLAKFITEKAIDTKIKVVSDKVSENTTKITGLDTRLATAEAQLGIGTGTSLTTRVEELETAVGQPNTATEGESNATGLYAEIESEAAAREGADDKIREDFGNEDARIEGLVTGEAERAQGAEKALGERIDGLNAVKTGDGAFVDVTVKQVSGAVTEVVVVENDIASAAALAQEVTNRGTAIQGINDKIGTVEDGKTVVEMIQAAKAAATTVVAKDEAAVHITLTSTTSEDGAVTYTIGESNIASADALTTLSGKVGENVAAIQTESARAQAAEKANADAIKVLNGYVSEDSKGDTGKSVRTIANEELVKQLIPENASESLNTLQEIAAWIQEHPEDAAAMNNAISANTASITALQASLSAETSAREKAIQDLDADVTSIEGTKVRVQVVEVDGKITEVNVTESDIASAQALTDEIDRAKAAEAANAKLISDETTDRQTAIGTLPEGESVMSVIEKNEKVTSEALNDLNSTVSAATSDITTLSGKVGENATAISGLDERLDTAESNISGLTTNLGTVSGDVETLKTNLGTVSGDVETLKTTVGDETSGLVKKVNDNELNIQGLIDAKHVVDVATSGTDATVSAGVVKNSENKLDFSGMVIDCGSYDEDENE